MFFKNKPGMSFAQFLDAIPELHTWDGGLTWNTGGFQREHLDPLGKLLSSLPSGCVCLETGAGASTIAMLMNTKGRIISIAPDATIYARIINFCDANRISYKHLDKRIALSEWELPTLARGRDPYLNFALIDGCHGWPNTFVDLLYVNAILKRGAFLMIDDVQLHSIKEMDRFLDEQPGFELTLDLGKSRIYKKLTEKNNFGEWNDQPYTIRKSKEYKSWTNPFDRAP